MRTLIFGIDVPGYASIIVSILFFGCIQLIGLGIMGEYVGRIYMETKSRPTYLVHRIYGNRTSQCTQIERLTMP